MLDKNAQTNKHAYIHTYIHTYKAQTYVHSYVIMSYIPSHTYIHAKQTRVLRLFGTAVMYLQLRLCMYHRCRWVRLKYSLPLWLKEEFKLPEILLYEHHFSMIDLDGGGTGGHEVILPEQFGIHFSISSQFISFHLISYHLNIRHIESMMPAIVDATELQQLLSSFGTAFSLQVFPYIHITHTYVHPYIHTDMHTYMHAYIYIHTYIHNRFNLGVLHIIFIPCIPSIVNYDRLLMVYLHMYVCMYVCVCVSVYSMYVWSVCMHVCMVCMYGR